MSNATALSVASVARPVAEGSAFARERASNGCTRMSAKTPNDLRQTVTGAWNNLKTPERRVAYDMARNARETEHRTRRAGPIQWLVPVPCHHNETGYSRGRIPTSCASRPR